MRIKRLVRIVKRTWSERTIASGAARGANCGFMMLIPRPLVVDIGILPEHDDCCGI